MTHVTTYSRSAGSPMKAAGSRLAGLDVFEDEPNIPQALREMSNVVLTPHVGSGTVETRAAMAKLAVDNLLSFRKNGTVLTAVPECAGLL